MLFSAIQFVLAGNKAMGPLITQLDSDDLQVRRKSLKTLTALGPQARDAIVPLIAFVQKKYDEERRKEYPCLYCEASFAVEALGSIGSAAATAEPTLIKFLKDGPQNTEFDQELMIALGRLGKHPKLIIPLLTPFIEEAVDHPPKRDLNYPLAAIRSLGALGPKAAPAVPVLIKALRGGWDIPCNAEKALLQVGTPEALAAIKGRNVDLNRRCGHDE